jgi:hypothetical protein
MFQNISDYLRDIAAGLVEDDTPSDRDIKEKRKIVKKPTESIEITQNKPGEESEVQKIQLPRVQPDVQERDKKDSKRPYIKPPRRLQDFKSEWKGEGSREKRKEYQKDYRMDNGNGYFKKTVK